ncbi:FGGY family carbohydrate kinase [Candidatus Borrarchaeum sp.]|uniref:FGGY family carbohydrate kinase n=1 Tax=Candidatus Borrarchaeum sp. TaxID=2846742 RepID=UPI00257B0EA8|nr:FGGY family carbohydrate kinase [Candidatus Borrarchaeum sp.]
MDDTDVHLIGIELGTSGLRVAVYDLDGNIIAAKETEIKEQTTNNWLTSLISIFPTELLKNVPSEKKILTVDGTSGSVIFVDKYGEPLFPPLMYFEKAKKETVARLYESESIKELINGGSKISTTSPLPKIMELKQENPQVFQNVYWIIPSTTWLLYTLLMKKNKTWTDNIQTDWTNSLKLGADITKSRPEWIHSIFEEAKIASDFLLPQIVAPGTPMGVAESELAEKLGISNATICQGMTDGTAGSLTMGLLHPNDTGINVGSTTVPKIVVEEKEDLPIHPAIYYHRHPIKGYLAGSATGAAGTFFRWFIEQIIGLPLEEAIPLAEKYDSPENECLFFPQGDRSPFDDPQMGAAFLNMWPADSESQQARGNLIRGLIAGMTLTESIYIKIFEELFEPISEVKILAKSTKWPFWNKLRASIYEKPIRIVQEKTPNIGALMPALLQLKLYKSPQDLEKLIRYQEKVDPDPNLADLYKDKKQRYYGQWQTLKKVYHAT